MKQKAIKAILSALFLAVLLFLGVTVSASVEAALPANFVLIHGGEFIMGSPETEFDRSSNEETQHRVRLSSFCMSKYAVTVAEFKRFVEASDYQTDAEKGGWSYIVSGSEFIKGKGINWYHGISGRVRPQSEKNHPVVYVSWNDAVAYCKWLSTKTGKRFRLPTEAEREYACRAGSRTPFHTGENLTTNQSNYNGNYPYKYNPKGVYRQNTVAVNSFLPNAWGLYNMHGNVAEWCMDLYHGTYYDMCYEKGIVTNPAGPGTGSKRVLRGGSWADNARYCRSAGRDYAPSDGRSGSIGFRLVLDP